MAGYMIVNNEVTDEAKYAEFRERIASAVEGAGGKYLVRGDPRGYGRRLESRPRGSGGIRRR